MIQKAFDDRNSQLEATTVSEPAQGGQDSSVTPKRPWLSGGRGVLIGMVMGMGLTLGGIFLMSAQQAKNSTPKATALAGVKSEAPAPSVTVAEVAASRVNRTLKATGTVAAVEMIPVLSQATGLQIQQILVDEGEFVRAGQVLARLDDSVLQAQLAQAKAAVAGAGARLAELRAGSRPEEIARAKENVKAAEAAVGQAKSDLELARKRAQRNQNLEAEGAIALDRLDEILNQERDKQSNLKQAQANLRQEQQQLAQLLAGPRQEVIRQAEAQLAQARGQLQLVAAQLKDARVVAPASGKIAERNARVGDITSPSDKLFAIIENGRLELQLKVPETQLSQIRLGQEVRVTSNANSRLNLLGTIREIEPMVDDRSRQAIVKVSLPTDKSLKPGMFLQAEIVTSIATGLSVPMGAVLPQSDGSAIAYLVRPDNSTVKVEPVVMGEILAGEKVEIKSGLQAGDRVVVKGAAYLKEGDRISIINEQ